MIASALDSCIEDDHLRFIFICCDPALNLEAQLALILHTLGLTTQEIGRAFLIPQAAAALRIKRAKKVTEDAGTLLRVPADHLLAERLPAVLKVVYLIFNEGFTATSSPGLIRGELCMEAIRLARILVNLTPGEPEAFGLLALLLFHESRRAARTSPAGDLVLLESQDRTLWDYDLIREGRDALDRALRRGRVGTYQLQASIAAVHADASTYADTDWKQILDLYDSLAQIDPSPVVALNRAVAMAFASGYHCGLARVQELAWGGELDEYHYFHAVRAELLRRVESTGEARQAYERALQLARNGSERRFLERRLRELGAG
jgi:RNA polymerase sigma-70 factor (ECF subfamily)